MIGARIAPAQAPAIPGLVFRAFDPDRDFPALVDLIREAHLADRIDWLPTEAQIRVDHEHNAAWDARRDLLLADVEGTLVAGARTDVRTRDGIGVHEVEGWVRPAWHPMAARRPIRSTIRARRGGYGRMVRVTAGSDRSGPDDQTRSARDGRLV